MIHPDCAQCCGAGRCHFCLAPGKVEGHYDKDGQRRMIRLCPTHFAWAATSNRAPLIEFSEAFVAELPAESIRRSESFQAAALNMELGISGGTNRVAAAH